MLQVVQMHVNICLLANTGAICNLRLYNFIQYKEVDFMALYVRFGAHAGCFLFLMLFFHLIGSLSRLPLAKHVHSTL